MQLARVLAVVLVSATCTAFIACSTSSTPTDPSASRTGTKTEAATRGEQSARGILGLPADPTTPKDADQAATMKRYEALATHMFELLEEQDPGALDTFGTELGSKDADRMVKAFAKMRGDLEAIAGGSELQARVAADPLFKGLVEAPAGVKTKNLHILAGPLPDAQIPDIGRGADGRFGDANTGFKGRVADIPDLASDLWPPGTLGKIDRGELTPDPESRLGAYAATAGYPPGTVGNAVHNAIGTIYVTFGDYGQEKIGRVFNSPEAKALYNDPVDSQSGYTMAQIELRYWNNVLKEDSWSPGGQLGSSFGASFRNWLQNNVFGSKPTAARPGTPGGGGGADGGAGGDGGDSNLSKTDCGDKADGWWCLDQGAGQGFMAYCQAKQIAGGCGCAGCTSAGVKASCSAAAPPAACPDQP